MKKFIYFNNYEEIQLLSKNFNNNLEKLNISKIKNTKKNNENKQKILIEKFNLYNNNINKIKDIYNIPQDYIIISSTNYLKILTLIIVQICNVYIKLNKNKPHFIITSFESNIIQNICKQLYKNNIIELTIIENENIIEEIKKNKKANTLLCIISNINNNIFYNLKKLSSYCKYYNILFLSNIEDELKNYIQNDKSIIYFNNQDLLIYNSNSYSINSNSLNNKSSNNKTSNNKLVNIYHLFIKKNIINKFHLDGILNNYTINPNNLSESILLNTLDIIKYNQNKEINFNKIKSMFEYIITNIQSKYKIIYYTNLINTENIKYFYNIPTIILFNNINNTIPLINNIYFSLFIPNIKFTNNNIIEYFKNNNIILNQNQRIPIECNKYLSDIKKGIINILLTPHTKISEINKFLNTLFNFIDNIFTITNNNNNNNKRKKNKNVRFTTPEFIILNKKFSNNSEKNKKIKSILKKNKYKK